MPTLRGDQTNSFDIKVGPASIWLGDGTWPLLAGVVVCFPIFMLQLVAGTLHVGPDGLRLTWAGRKLFIDARSMVRLEPFGAGPTALGLPSSETGISVHRRDNGPVRIALGLGSSNALSTQTIVRVIRRIEQVIIGLDVRAVGASSRASPVVGEAQRIGSQISGRLAPARSQPCASPTLVARSSDRSSRERK
jgi:hypothetical protein